MKVIKNKKIMKQKHITISKEVVGHFLFTHSESEII